MATNVIQFPIRAVLGVITGPSEWTDANEATARPLPVALPVRVVEVEPDHFGPRHSLVATEDTNCGLCGDPIAKGDVVTYVRDRKDAADKVVHVPCMATDLARSFSITSAFGRRGRR